MSTIGGGFCYDIGGLRVLTGGRDTHFSVCFQQLVLVQLMNLILFAVGSWRVSVLLNKSTLSRTATITRNLYIKAIVLLGLLAVKIAEIYLSTRLATPSKINAITVSAIISLVAYTLSLAIHYLEQTRNKSQAHLMVLYWNVQLCLLGIWYWTQAIMGISASPQSHYFISSVAEGVLIVAIWLFELLTNRKTLKELSKNSLEEQGVCPEKYANIYSRLTFQWMGHLLSQGRKKVLGLKDLWQLPSYLRVEPAIEKFEREWEVEIQRYPDSPNLWRVMSRAYGKVVFISMFFKLIQDLLGFSQTLLFSRLLKFVNTYNNSNRETRSIAEGFILSGTMLLAALLQTLFLHQYFHISFYVGINVKSALTAVVFKKSLKLSNASKNKLSTGEIFNRMSVDAQKISDVVSYINTLWSGPLQIVISVALLYNTIGYSAFVGVGVMIVFLPFTLFLGQRLQGIQKQLMVNKDKRVRLIDEILLNIKSIKLYSWESAFIAKTDKARNYGELKTLRSYGVNYGYQSFVTTLTSFMVSFLTFTVYAFVDNKSKGPLTAQLIFVSLSLFNLLKFPLFILPMIFSFTIEANVSCRRVAALLVSEELQSDSVKRIPFDRSLDSGSGHDKNMVSIEDGSFTWGITKPTDSKADKKKKKDKKKKDKKNRKKKEDSTAEEDSKSEPIETSKPTIQDINFRSDYGQLTCIVGRVGSGKSTLISSILGDTKKLSGAVKVCGRVAYAPQQPWIMNATFRENILFGQPLDMPYYKKVIKYCELEKDIAMLKGGDMAEIGESGINLSGGQKARLSLARAVYSRAHVYLLDDPLSAVDAHVGRNLVKNVIGPNGLLKNKARILVTHAVQYLPMMDYIYFMDDGKIVEEGTYSNLHNNPASHLVELIGEVEEDIDEGEAELDNVGSSGSSIINGIDDENIFRAERKSSQNRRDSISTIGTALDLLMSENSELHNQRLFDPLNTSDSQSEIDLKANKQKDESNEKEGQLIEDEKSKEGRVKLIYFWNYIRAASISGISVYMITLILSQLFSVASSIWLQVWSNANSKATATHPTLYYILIYGLFGLLQALSASTQNLTIWIFVAVRAAKTTHAQLLNGVMKSPMSFFDTTPLGRVLNRFSKDQETIDTQIPRSFDSWAQSILSVISSLVVIIVSFYLFAIVIIPISVAYVFIYRHYIVSSRELKRLESTTRSPIYAQFQESLSGTSTIRSYGHNSRFINSNIALIKKNAIAQFPYLTLNRWLAVRLEFIGGLIIFFASLFAVVNIYLGGRNGGTSGASTARVGLAISYSLSITQNLSWGIRQTAELENNVVAVERNREYSSLASEGLDNVEKVKPPKDWPNKGEVVLSNYSTRYREGLDLILRNVNLTIPAGSRVGVVGRTGAGKSSLSLALFRIIEAAGGKISIDNIDVSQIELSDLRSNLLIIPQDPFLFGDTLRNNLDPFGNHSDAQIWEALELSRLKPWAEQQSNLASTEETGEDEGYNRSSGLDIQINQGGTNLSLGQRQLVCLARALLRQSKVLILDEATAAIDVETDRFVQEVIRTEFRDCTVITIAHRLNTIMDSDYILVLDKGEVAEFGNPAELSSNPDSHFSYLIQQSHEND